MLGENVTGTVGVALVPGGSKWHVEVHRGQ